jgi:homoserine kinase type II
VRRRRIVCMAVYTEVAEEELEPFLAAYDVGSVVSIKGIAEGVENSNFLLHAEAGYFILTIYEKRVAEADLPFFLGLLEHLSAGGVTCPQPVRNRKGEMLGRLAGKPAAVVTFLDGVSVRRPDARHCGMVGEALARMHAAGAGFALARRNALSLDGWAALFRAAENRADEVLPGLAVTLAEEIARLERTWPRDLPSGVIHADLFPDNVFFLAGRLSGLIDFYFACNDFLAYDLAICLNAWCFEPDASFNITRGMALINGYERVRALSEAETLALPTLARGAAVRFLLTRLVDWLDRPAGALVRPKDPIEYLKKLRFHQQAESARDYGWLR